MKLPIMLSPPVPYYLLHLRLKKSSSAPCCRSPLACFVFLNVRYPISHQYKTTGKIIVLYCNPYIFG